MSFHPEGVNGASQPTQLQGRCKAAAYASVTVCSTGRDRTPGIRYQNAKSRRKVFDFLPPAQMCSVTVAYVSSARAAGFVVSLFQGCSLGVFGLGFLKSDFGRIELYL